MEFFGMSAESSFSAKDGTLTIPGLLNGPYEFSGAFEMPRGYYVASVRDRDRVRSVVRVEFSEDVRNVPFDGILTNGKFGANLLVRVAGRRDQARRIGGCAGRAAGDTR